MKGFKDLVFNTEKRFTEEKKYSKIFFNNGYGVSVISGYGAFSNELHPYELAVLYGNEEDFHLVYDNEVADGDVVGYLTENEVNELMIKVQNFKP